MLDTVAGRYAGVRKEADHVGYGFQSVGRVTGGAESYHNLCAADLHRNCQFYSRHADINLHFHLSAAMAHDVIPGDVIRLTTVLQTCTHLDLRIASHRIICLQTCF